MAETAGHASAKRVEKLRPIGENSDGQNPHQFLRRIQEHAEVEHTPEADIWITGKTMAELRAAQMNDSTVKQILSWKESARDRPSWKEISHLPYVVKTYWSQWDRLEVRDGVLYRKWINTDLNTVTWQLVLPKCWRKEVLQQLHSENVAVHLGVSRTIARVRSHFYWNDYHIFVRRWVARCHQCQAQKRPMRSVRKPLQQYEVGAPLKRIALDVFGPLSVSKTEKYIQEESPCGTPVTMVDCGVQTEDQIPRPATMVISAVQTEDPVTIRRPLTRPVNQSSVERKTF